MNKDEAKRTQIEQAIVAASRKIPVFTKGRDAEWVNDESAEEFVDAWYELVQYFQRYTDTVIGLEALQMYLVFVEALRDVTHSETISKERCQKAEELLDGLEDKMEEIIKEGGRNWAALQINSGDDN